MQVNIKEVPREYALDEDCSLEEPWIFNCTHPDTVVEEVVENFDTIHGVQEEISQMLVCANSNCGEVIDENWRGR